MPDTDLEQDIDRQLEMFRRMLRIRIFEEIVGALVLAGELTTTHASIGQEAAIVGSCMALGSDDYMTGTHRSHGHPIGKGAKLGPLMAELYGKVTGICKGKGGSMHLADFSVGSLGESSIVAGAIPIATGAALSAKIRQSGQVVLCFFGDGATNEGNFHESLNIAGTFGLPVVYLCENNAYAITMKALDTTAVADVASRASAYGMPGATVDGQDVVAVYEAAVKAVDRARQGGGPSLVEAKTYRYHDHAEGMPDLGYRTADEIAVWRSRDPIEIHRVRLLAKGVAETTLAAITAEVKAEVDEALAFAQQSSFPAPEAAYEDLYADPFPIAHPAF